MLTIHKDPQGNTLCTSVQMHAYAHVQAHINTRVYVHMFSSIPACPSRAGAGAGVGFSVTKPESMCPPGH